MKTRKSGKFISSKKTRKRPGRPKIRFGARRKGKTSRAAGAGQWKWKHLELAAAKAGAGVALAAAEGSVSGLSSSEQMQQSFQGWYKENAPDDLPFPALLQIALAYRGGFAAKGDPSKLWIPLPLQGQATAIVTASNEETTLPAVVTELQKLPLHEIIIVLNGCSDGSFTAVRRDSKMMILSFPDRLGHDVGRAVGAAAASGDTLLFTDGDICVAAEDLAAFLLAVDRGSDLALNDISPYLPPFPQQDEVSRCKSFLNLALGRPDLKANSLTAVPHALSRRALTVLSPHALIVPPKAQALALASGLSVNAPHSVDVVRKNRIRGGNTGTGNAVAGLILGDHVEALGEVMKMEGVRLRYTTLPRSELAKVRNAL
ncbi:glycosyltransferase [Paenibacillus puldeungensis]|uniref:Glycosyltransferase n=1 Tax=Paenibacillus puldeungensis TaxID=696536 RepID=A0ABW3S0I5_9BACL